ncbi:hypothetical protein BDIM_26760 [Brevundimonas diminuta ATCC 11568]|nr:hypothetical protein BDIM_26760 [Brevundimonas diminuta ATCC 11568]
MQPYEVASDDQVGMIFDQLPQRGVARQVICDGDLGSSEVGSEIDLWRGYLIVYY